MWTGDHFSPHLSRRFLLKKESFSWHIFCIIIIERSEKMKKHLAIIAFLILLTPCLAFSDMVTFRVGYFFPRAKLSGPINDPNDLWNVEFLNMDFEKSDFNDSTFGFTYEYFLSNQLSLALSIDGYSQKKLGMYRDYAAITASDGYDYAFENEDGYAISHVFDVSITPIQLSLKLAPTGRRGKFIPYIGGGAGVYLWNVRLAGDMIDFEDWYEFTDGTIGFSITGVDAREDNKISIGFHALGGIMFPVANRISIDGQFKFNFLNGELTEGFEGFDSFDLSGYQISIGLNYWF